MKHFHRKSKNLPKSELKNARTYLPKNFLTVDKIKLAEDLSVKICRPIFSRSVILRRPCTEDKSQQVNF